MTGQYTNVWTSGYSYKGKCECLPYNYWGTSGCTPQLLESIPCTDPTANPSECLDGSGLYCDSTTFACKCLSNYYWTSASKKCCNFF